MHKFGAWPPQNSWLYLPVRIMYIHVYKIQAYYKYTSIQVYKTKYTNKSILTKSIHNFYVYMIQTYLMISYPCNELDQLTPAKHCFKVCTDVR